MEMTFGPYGWCIRPDISSPLDNGPFSTVYFSCSVLKMVEKYPPWIDGHWSVMGNKYLPLINTFSNIESSYTMIINGTKFHQ